MTPDSLLAHQYAVEEAVKLLPSDRAFLFAVACAERQAVVYRKAVEKVPTAPVRDIRPFLDAAWESVTLRTSIPSDYRQTIRAAIPYPEGDDFMGNLLFILGNIYGLLSLLEDRDVRPCHVSAENNLGLVTRYIHLSQRIPASVVVSPVVLNHPLVTEEKLRQLDDIELLRGMEGAGDAAPLRTRSSGVDLFGGNWY